MYGCSAWVHVRVPLQPEYLLNLYNPFIFSQNLYIAAAVQNATKMAGKATCIMNLYKYQGYTPIQLL